MEYRFVSLWSHCIYNSVVFMTSLCAYTKKLNSNYHIVNKITLALKLQSNNLCLLEFNLKFIACHHHYSLAQYLSTPAWTLHF